MQTQAGDDLIERIRTHSADDDVVGPAANDLLSELYAGYPVENLGRLLHSGDDAAVGAGIWLLSELGERAAPMMDEIPALLAHPLRRVRYFAIEVVLLCADARHGSVIAQVMNLSRDFESAVRWKVLEFLAEATDDQLAAGAAALEPGQVKELAEWLIRLDEEEEPDPRDVVARLEGPDPLARLFAAAAAAHLSDEDDPNLLQHAATADDEEISSFARQRLEELTG
ncbi:hypothetical protein [Nonomuraea helvata]|uniref:HEAT repeat domain-containing protein n=1 Tax=Nonomuraea helvata TaxID=37484 RepID=A0ABV5RXW7_9ACTN